MAQQAGRTCAGCNVVTAASLAAASFRPERCSTTRRHSCTALSTTPVTLGCFNGNLFHFRIHWHTGTHSTQAHTDYRDFQGGMVWHQHRAPAQPTLHVPRWLPAQGRPRNMRHPCPEKTR